jgi:cyclophilin family peptidyl-prolyl cis-trans isomerase
METPLGDIEIELFDEVAPGTVENFLNYVNDGDYEDSFVHRSVPGFVIQGGGFTFEFDASDDNDGSVDIIRLSPDVFCQAIIDAAAAN